MSRTQISSAIDAGSIDCNERLDLRRLILMELVFFWRLDDEQEFKMGLVDRIGPETRTGSSDSHSECLAEASGRMARPSWRNGIIPDGWCQGRWSNLG